MGEIERFRIVDALFIIGSIVTFIADQATGQTAGMHTQQWQQTVGNSTLIICNLFFDGYLDLNVSMARAREVSRGSEHLVGNSFDINHARAEGAGVGRGRRSVTRPFKQFPPTPGPGFVSRIIAPPNYPLPRPRHTPLYCPLCLTLAA